MTNARNVDAEAQRETSGHLEVGRGRAEGSGQAQVGRGQEHRRALSYKLHVAKTSSDSTIAPNRAWGLGGIQR